MKAVVKWLDNKTFVGESGSGHCVVMDGPESAGGQNIGVRPMEMLLLGIGGCASFDVISILQKSRQLVNDCHVTLKATRADTVPAVFTDIHVAFDVWGDALNATQVARAVELTTTKYCSASIMMQAAKVNITHNFTIHNTGDINA